MRKTERVIEDRFMSTSEAADYAGVDETTIRDWFDLGYITGQSMPYGGRTIRRISVLSLQAYLRKRLSEADQAAT